MDMGMSSVRKHVEPVLGAQGAGGPLRVVGLPVQAALALVVAVLMST